MPWTSLITALEARDGSAVALLRILTDRAERPEDRSLALHLRALLCFRAGDAKGGGEAFEQASVIERQAGYTESAAHTLHAVALFANVGGDLGKVRGYYRESLEQLRRMKNTAGMGLCLRSLGEMALAAGMTDQARVIWSRCLQCQTAVRPAETGLVRAWKHRLPVVTKAAG